MSYPPPPNPDNDMRAQPNQMPAAIQLPMNALKTLAHYYKQFGWAVKLTGQRVPRELDMALKAIADTDDPRAVQDLQSMAYGGQPMQNPYDIGPQELPSPQIGEPVMTQHMAETAYRLHQMGWGTRQIAEEFTKNGSPVSHGTVARRIIEVEEMMHYGRRDFLIKIARLAVIVGVWVGSLAIIHFFF